MELETVNRLFLELSQFSTATTARELALIKELAEVKAQRDDLIADLAAAKVTTTDAQVPATSKSEDGNHE